MSFLEMVSKFNQKADSHSKSQTLNPFSGQFEQSRSPSPRFSREEYGKPIAGSKTDMRGRKAKTHICREILELCTVIHDVGTYNAKKRDPDDDDDDEQDDGTIIVSFGELFQIYTKISDKVVGLLIAAKRRGFVYFDREILFQRRDDDVLIALLKPISEINKILKEDINQTNAPAAAAVESKPAEKKKSTSKTKRVNKPSDCNNKEQTIDNCTATVDETNNVILEVNGDAVQAEVEKNGGENDGGRETGESKEENIITINGGGEEIGINDEIICNGGGGGEIDGGETVVKIEINGGADCNDETRDGSEEVRGEPEIAEIPIDENQLNLDGGEIVEVVNNVVGDVPENTEIALEGAIEEEIKTIEANGIEVVVSENVDSTDGGEEAEDKNENVVSTNGEEAEDTSENVDSTDGEEVEEILKNVQVEKHHVDVTNESIKGVANVNGETEHIFLSEN